MKARPKTAFLCGLFLGAVTATLMIRVWRPPAPIASDLPSPEAEPFESPFEELEKLTGDWASGDGRQSAKFDDRLLHFQVAKGWPDLEAKTFLLGRELQFLSESGFYTLTFESTDPQSIRVIKEDLATKDLISFTLYREGSPRARSRPVLPDLPRPEKIQAILDAIPGIKTGESPESVKKRMLPPQSDQLEILTAHSSLGQTDEIWSLGEGDEWMLNLSYVDGKGVVRFQVVRGSVKAMREGDWEISEYVYPYFVDGKLVSGTSSSGMQVTAPAGK